MKKIKEFIKSFLKDPLFLSYWEDSWSSRESNSNKLSERIFGYSRRKFSRSQGRDSQMFIEDIYTGIMPFMLYRGEREKYPAKFEPANSTKKRLIIDGISQHDHTYDLEDALCEFVRRTAQLLFSDGIVFYEIIYERNEANELVNFDLENIEPSYLFKFWKNYYQIIPWWVAKNCRIRAQIIKIPAEKIFCINLPKQYGNKRKLSSVLKNLSRIGRVIIPEFQMEAMKINKNVGFDLKKFSETKYLEIAKRTKKFGWDQRKISNDSITEYYSMVRFLRWKKIEAVIRDHIITNLNEAMNRPPLNLGIQVNMENLFSPEDVEKQEKLLKAGGIKFMDIFNSLKI